MHKAVRIKLFQQMPNYRKPSSFLIKESYPLPPYSSVIGMVHAVCGFLDRYHPMQVSIQGKSASSVSDYAVMYIFAAESAIFDKDKNTNENVPRGTLVKGVDNIKDTSLYRSPKSVELLTDVELVIHIIPEDEAELDVIAESFKNPPEYISLGRREDIARIDEVKITELEDEFDEANFQYSAYVPTDCLTEFEDSDQIKGTVYKIPKVFDTSAKSGMRTWKEVVKVRHMPQNASVSEEIFENENVMFDKDEETPVFFA